MVQAGAGAAIGLGDDQYRAAGARLVDQLACAVHLRYSLSM